MCGVHVMTTFRKFQLHEGKLHVSLCEMLDFELRINCCYQDHFSVDKDILQNSFFRGCIVRENLSWFVSALSSRNNNKCLEIEICRHFDADVIQPCRAVAFLISRELLIVNY